MHVVLITFVIKTVKTGVQISHEATTLAEHACALPADEDEQLMAVFMENVCAWGGCRAGFPSLAALIHHIEDTHIDYDPLVIEQKEASQPSCLPLSYVLKFFTEAARRELLASQQAQEHARRSLLSHTKPPSSVRSNTPTDNYHQSYLKRPVFQSEMKRFDSSKSLENFNPQLGSEFDDEDLMTQSEDSNDSWTTAEEYSSEFILRHGSRMNAHAAPAAQGSAAAEKPFACPVPGCKKRYKNVNGIKYHSKNGHKKDGKVKKAYKCHCGKNYKTAQGLKTHSISQHFANNQSSLIATAVHSFVLTSSHNTGIINTRLVRLYDTNTAAVSLTSSGTPEHGFTNLQTVSNEPGAGNFEVDVNTNRSSPSRNSQLADANGLGSVY